MAREVHSHLRMPLLATKYCGLMEFQPSDLFDFPAGLPGFEREESFLPISLPGMAPIVLLQSSATPDLCFPALPILVADPNYELGVSYEDLSSLELGTRRQPVIGQEVLVLALLCVREGRAATANLMAPIIVNLKTRRALQAVRCDHRYSHEQTIAPVLEEASC